MILPGFVGASYKDIAPEVNCEDCSNLVPFKASGFAPKQKLVLYGSPGMRLWKTVGGGPERGNITIENYTFVVSGGEVYSIDPAGTVQLEGACANDQKPVRMVANNDQILLISAGIAYVIAFGAVTPVASPPWARAADCEYKSGYFIVLEDDGQPVGGLFFISAFNDAASWDPLDFSNAPASNNKLRALRVSHDDLWVMGTVVNQPFFYNGQVEFPFLLNEPGVMQQGIMSRDSVSLLDNTMFWLGRNQDGVLQGFYADGYRAQRWSSDEQEAQWANYANPEEAESWVYNIEGHPTYHINFLSAGKSWRYDRATGLPHRVSFRNPLTGAEECHRGANHSVRGTMHIIGDRETGDIWEFTNAVNADGDNPLVAMRQCPVPYAGLNLCFFPWFRLITPGGIGDGTNLDPLLAPVSPEANPKWMLSWSNDSGRNFGPEIELPAGPQGDYETICQAWGLGSGINRVYRVTMSANRPRCIIGAEYDMTKGKS